MNETGNVERNARRAAVVAAPVRTLVFAPVAALLLASSAVPCVAQSVAPRVARTSPAREEKRVDRPRMQPATHEAIRRGLDFLARAQNADGSFGSRPFARNVGVCSLIGMAFVSHGSTPGRGPHGKAVTRTVDYLLHQSQESGFITAAGATSHGPMYEHGFATLLLAEVYGMTPDPRIREKLVRAVRLIVENQNQEGGWRYQPERRDADISVTICQMMALRAARNAGIFVPNETIDRCVDYVKRCQNPDGGFSYMLGARGSSMFPRSAAGVVTLYSAGVYEGEELRRGLEYLAQHLPGKERRVEDGHYFYGQYYGVQAMWQAGGEYWARWYPAIHDELVARQRPDGAWLDTISPEYGTAMACLILQMPQSHLPIFQK